ncbi:MAG: Wzz/FepE/Etk N-terminal domain-containing protein [Eubacteriales bacterium]|nr:Wzz/FepE/Etk N-terminal domain-containing protein [Eubacteriales bacterium]
METENRNDEVEIDLREIFAILLDKLAVIVLAAVLGAAVAFTFTKFLISPVYKARTQVYVTNNKLTTTDQINVSDLQSSNYLTKDYMILVKSNPVLDKVIADLNLKMSTSELAGKISVSTPTDTRILTIAVNDKDPMMAKKIADAVREASKAQIQSVMGIETVNTVEDAKLPESPISPNTKMNILIGFALGFIIAVAVIIIRFMLDDTIKAQEDVEKYLGLSVLGLIPELETTDNKKKKKKKKNK